jgi:hypothetical protein
MVAALSSRSAGIVIEQAQCIHQPLGYFAVAPLLFTVIVVDVVDVRERGGN